MVAPSQKTSCKRTKQDEVLHIIPNKTGIFSVIGADTFLGARMVKHLSDTCKTVYGFHRKKISSSR